MVALVPALVSQCLLVVPDEPTVPCHEVARIVDSQGLLDVGHDEIIELSHSRGRVISSSLGQHSETTCQYLPVTSLPTTHWPAFAGADAGDT